MQIIIGQAEIEQAITAHVLQKIAISPGQNVEIELKATRGEVGYQAFITIGEISKTAPLVGPVNTKPPSTPAEVRQMMAAEAEAEAETTEVEVQPTTVPDNESEAEVVEEVQVEQAAVPAILKPRIPRLIPQAQVAAQQSVAEPVAEQVGGSDAPPPRKLFGGFSKPKN